MSCLSKMNRIVTFTKTRVSIVKVPESPLENEKPICCILLSSRKTLMYVMWPNTNPGQQDKNEKIGASHNLVVDWKLLSLSNVGENNILPAFICIPSYLKYYEKILIIRSILDISPKFNLFTVKELFVHFIRMIIRLLLEISVIYVPVPYTSQL